MHISLAEYAIGIVGIISKSFISGVLFRQKIFKRFPVFTCYIVFMLFGESVALWELFRKVSTLQYAYTYYFVQFASIGLAFGVIYEIFKTVLEPYDAVRRVWRFLFALTSVILIIISIVWLLYGSGPQVDRLTQTMNVLLRSVRVIQVGLLLLLFSLASSLGLTWRSYSFGIALGYGTYAIVDLVLSAMRLEYGDAVWKLESYCTTIAYGTSVLIWAWYVMQPEKLAGRLAVIPYNDIEKWNEKLEELLKPKSAKKTDVEEEENDGQPASR